MGLVIYASYYKCDPVTRGHIAKSDQLLPYFVMEIAAAMPGLPGLFVSGVFSAALRFAALLSSVCSLNDRIITK